MVIGLFTRPVAFILAGEMAFAYFLAHAPQGFFPLLNQGELAVLYCFVFLYFAAAGAGRSEEHTSELQSLMRISYAVFCLKKKKNRDRTKHPTPNLLTLKRTSL